MSAEKKKKKKNQKNLVNNILFFFSIKELSSKIKWNASNSEKHVYI